MKKLLVLCLILLTINNTGPIYAESEWNTVEEWCENADQVESFEGLLQIPGIDKSYSVIDGVLFINHTLLRYPGKKQDLVYAVPEGTEGIDERAFDSVGSEIARDIILPVSCADIGYNDTYDSVWGTNGQFAQVTNYQVAKDNPRFSSQDGVLYSKDMSILLSYPNTRSDERFIVPEGVVRIGAFAFLGCGLKEISFPTSLRTIGEYAFYGNQFSSLFFNEGLIYIDTSAFEACSLIKEITFPSTLLIIGYNSFSQCFVLNNVTLPANLVMLSSYAFYGAPIKDMILPARLQYIGDDICVFGSASGDDQTPFYYVYPNTYAYYWVQERAVQYKVMW